MNIEELKRLGEKWANLPAGKEANEIADEVMDKLPELLQEMQQLEKACAEMRDVIQMFDNNSVTDNEHIAIVHALSTSCGSDYIHKDEIKPLVEALEFIRNNVSMDVHCGSRAEQSLAHAERLMKGEKE